jgi:alpha-galactosidase
METTRRAALGMLGMSTAMLPLFQQRAVASALSSPMAVIGNGRVAIEFDHAMNSRLLFAGAPITAFGPSETLAIDKKRRVEKFLFTEQFSESGRQCVRGIAAEGLEKCIRIGMDAKFPDLVFLEISFKNTGSASVDISSWSAAAHELPRSEGGLWSFSGASHADRRDWVQPVKPGFDQRNYMGMNASDYGSGIPVSDIWSRNVGLAVGHVETVPKLLALPITATTSGARIAIESDQAITLAPGESFSTPALFIALHKGDYFQALDGYRQVMSAKGIAAPECGPDCYEPVWCAWGYERNVTAEQVLGTLPKVKELGFKTAVLDDGWQTSEGDWQLDPTKFPNGDADMIAFVKSIKAQGIQPRLWLAPLAVDPGTDLLRNHTDMLLLDQYGAVNDVTWWNSFTLCPAYKPTVDYFKALVAKIIGEWGFEGLKLDGQHLNGVAPCHNPAHKHQRPEESYEKLQDFWQAIYDTAIAINPKAVVELCPCGTAFAFHNIGAMNQTPASDPLSSWQVRLKGKTFKALMGASAPYSGDHVELSDNRDDFASTVGIGGVISTKFTWPRDTDKPTGPLPPGGFVLTADKEKLWRKWATLYREKMLPLGTYMGGLYDIGFDRPEAHVVEKDGKLHFAFYADKWNGPIELRGLGKRSYTLTDMFTGKAMGRVSGQAPKISASFEKFLLIEASPAKAVRA